MPQNPEKTKQKEISSPASTGGVGPVYENRIQAAFLALMLSGGPVPTQLCTSIEAIRLQRRYDEYNVDDVIVECSNPRTNQKHKLLAQIKHSVSITRSSKELSEVMLAAWMDYNNSEKYSKEYDTVALITGALAKIDIESTLPILDWARHSQTSEEFFQKIATPKFSSADKREKLEVLRYHLEQANGSEALDDESVWKFLKCFYLIGYDLDSASGGVLPLLLSMLRLCIIETVSPDEVWARLVNEVQNSNPAAGTITLKTLPKDILDYFKTGISLAACPSIEKLKEHGDLILKGTNTEIAGTHIRRIRYIDHMADLANKCNFILVTGPRGSGKSAITKEFVEEHASSGYCFCLRTEDLNQPHLDHVFTSVGIDLSLSDLSERFALIPRKYLIIESLEKLLELSNRAAFCDLLEYLKGHKDWTVIASCREYALHQICITYLNKKDVLHEVVKVSDFTDDEFDEILDAHASLKPLVCHQKMNALLRNPFMADMAIRVIASSAQTNVTDEKSFKEAVWKNVIRKESDRSGGMPGRRAEVFIQISTQRAKRMLYEVSGSDFDSTVLYSLEADGLVSRDSDRDLVRPSHDVLEDWAIEAFIEKAHYDNTDVATFLESIGSEPAMLRAFRYWLHQKTSVLPDAPNIIEWCFKTLTSSDVPNYWCDEIIISIISGQQTKTFLDSLKEQLLHNEHRLLKKTCFLMRVACKVSNTSDMQELVGNSNRFTNLLYVPSGDCWPQVIQFIYRNRDDINLSAWPEIYLLLDDYASLANYVKPFQPEAARETGLLALRLLESLKDEYHSDLRVKLLMIVTKLFPVLEEEVRDILEQDAFGKASKDQPRYISSLSKLILVDYYGSAMWSKHAPDLVIRLARQEWIIHEQHRQYRHPRYRRIDVEESFGLSQKDVWSGFHPPTGFKGPFLSLLCWHESEGLELILELCNHCVEKYVESQLDGEGDYKVDVILNDGTVHEQYCSGRLWGGYRGITVLPALLESALMALENWLVGKARQEDDNSLQDILTNIILKSNSVLTTAVVASIAIGFPEKAGDAVWPLFRTGAFYDLDMQRKIQESSVRSINWHGGMLNNDPYSAVYAQEREDSCSWKWREQDLEFLLLRLQLSSERDKAYDIIDNYLKVFSEKEPDSEGWRFRLIRLDMRKHKAIADKENNCIRFENTEELPLDLQKTAEETEKQVGENQSLLHLFFWADKEFTGESTEGTHYCLDPDRILPEIKRQYEILKVKSEKQDILSCDMEGVVKGMAILLRDHLERLDEADIAWCVGNLIDCISNCLRHDQPRRRQVYEKSSIEVAQILPIILELTDKPQKGEIRMLIVEALTHPNSDFRKSIASGIQKHLWSVEPEFAQRCFNGAFEFARLQSKYHISYYSEEDKPEVTQRMSKLREQIVHEIKPVNSDEISFDTHASSTLLIPFEMLPSGFNNQRHDTFFVKLITMLQDVSRIDKKRRREVDRYFNASKVYEFSKLLNRYLAVLSSDRRDTIVQSILSRIVDSLDLVDQLLLFYLGESEQAGTVDMFWELWVQISQETLSHLNCIMPDRNGNDKGEAMIRRLLFADFPIQEQRHKKELSEILKVGRIPILNFANDACGNATIYQYFGRLVFLFPSMFLPDGLFILSSNCKKNSGVMSEITVFYLEHLLHMLLVPGTSTNQISRQCYDALLVLLNAMVDKGSTAGFYLRDHLLTLKPV